MSGRADVRAAQAARRDSARPRDTRFARLYGARWWHLLVLSAMVAVTAYAVSRLLGAPALFPIVVWFLGAAVVWDLVVGPAAAAVDRGLRAVTRRPRGRVSGLNHLRVPAVLSAALLLASGSLVLRRSEQVYTAKTGLSQDPYLWRWVAVTAVLFAVSGVLWAVRRRRARR